MSGRSLIAASGDPYSMLAYTVNADQDRMSRYREYLDFNRGLQHVERRRAGERRLVFNYGRVLVRKSISYMFAMPPTFDALGADGQDAPNADVVEALLHEVYDELSLHTLDFDTAVDAGVLGDGAFKVTWDARERRAIVASIDPQQLWCWWRADDPRVVYRVVQKYALSAEQVNDIYGVSIDVNMASQAATIPVIESWTDREYSVEISGTLARRGRNPYGWIPYVVFPNQARPHEFWGDSDLVDLLDVCRELNRRMTTVADVLHYSGKPVAVLEGVTGTEALRNEAGQIWELPEDAKAYLLDLLAGGGVGLHIDYIGELRTMLHDLAETPRTAFGDSGRALSGVALEVEVQPLVQKVTRKRRVWDRVYRERNTRVLDLYERFGGRSEIAGQRRTRVGWGDMLPTDRTATVNEEATLVAAEIHSRVEAARRLGHDNPEEIVAAAMAEAAQLADQQAARDNQNQNAGAGSEGDAQHGNGG